MWRDELLEGWARKPVDFSGKAAVSAVRCDPRRKASAGFDKIGISAL